MTAGDVYRYSSYGWNLLYVVLRQTSTDIHILVLENINASGWGFDVGCVTKFDIDSIMHHDSYKL